MTRVNSDLGNPGYGAIGIWVEAYETANNGTSSTVHVRGGYYNNSPYVIYASTAYVSLNGRGNVSFATASPGDHVTDEFDVEVAHNGDGSAVSASYSCYGTSTYPSNSVNPTVSVTTSANPRYAVTYAGNGGTTPSGQTKVYGINLGLNGSTSRYGYTFLYWAGSDGNTYYPGSVFTGNYGLTLTAVWQINTWQVSYNANGGYSAPSNQVKTYNQRLYLSADKPSKALYNFVSWSGSDGNTYYQGSPFDGNHALTLTANWTLAYIQPTINNVLAYHTDSSGNSGDFDYITVKVNWTVNRDIYPSNIGQSIRIRYKEVGTSTWITEAEVYLLSSAKQSGENYITFGGSLAHDKSYDIETYVCDNNQPSMGATRYSVAPGTMYYMDINPYNHHMGFGGKAEDAYPYCFKVDGVVVAYIDGTGFHNV